MHKILIVEDKDSMALMLKETLVTEGYEALIASTGAEGIEKIRTENVEMVLTDLKLPEKDGFQVLKASKEENPLRPVIVMTAFGSVEKAVEAMKEGAYDFITKPFDTDHLLLRIKRALENQRLITENILLREEFSSRYGLPEILGRSQAILEVAEKIRKSAPAKTTILLLGESGTGKELFARAVHQLSGRGDYPFVPLNCAAIPRDLLEAELFGYERGAFTGADATKPGKFELAQNGTIFLDEIGELDIALQAKLLRVIQEGEVERLGSTKPLKIDVRVVAASNRDLEDAMENGTFREDLYYRLNVFPVTIPPLRDRKQDIPLLAEHFVTKYSHSLKAGRKKLSPEALDVLIKYRWKGNVRELQNTIERAIILCEGDLIRPEHVSIREAQSRPTISDMPMDVSLEEVARNALKAAESERIRMALRETGGNKSKAASLLKVSYKTLLTKIRDYEINVDD